VKAPLGKLVQKFGRIGRLERQLPGDHLIEENSQGEHVARFADFGAQKLLGRAAGQCAYPLVGGGDASLLWRAQQMGNAKVEHLHQLPAIVARPHEDVAGLEISVKNTAPMRRLNRRTDLPEQLQRAGGRQSPLSLEELLQGEAVHVFHH